MEFHEVASIFPLLEGPELKRLVEDIKTNGLIEPIWTYQGKIIDGRNRYRACLEAGVEPRYRKWDGAGLTDSVHFVVSMNLERRHLTPSQRAAVAVKAEEVMEGLEDEARKRQLSGLKRGDVSPVAENIPEREKGRARDQAGEMVGVSGRLVSDAKTIVEKYPDKFAEIMSGDKTVHQVKREIRRETAIQAVKTAPELKGKFRVIYADPPWKYGDSGYGSGPTAIAAEFHYPVMSIDELCVLPVKDLAVDNAVLFLWVTSPILEDAFAIINAWGFTYKASFVWDKIKHNVGHYNSVRHEFLLIATRGSCVPDDRELVDSVQSIEKGGHSEKPERFREIINQMYPHGTRVELFARAERPGWKVWGNQI